ncbi:pheST operon leader peptide PheM [Serratia sp. NPDC078593]
MFAAIFRFFFYFSA